ncbi:MAG: hypothetical protein ACLTDZ_03360 [Oscillospiraceae bacterium]
MPLCRLHKSLFVCSKIMLFLITDLVFAALMVLFNVGLDGMSVLPAVLVQTAILSLIMALGRLRLYHASAGL